MISSLDLLALLLVGGSLFAIVLNYVMSRKYVAYEAELKSKQ